MRFGLSFSDSESTKKTSGNDVDIKSLVFNITIFVLACIILLMSYSLYQKIFNGNQKIFKEESDENISEIIQVEVLNGCGVGGVAERFTEYLRANGCDVVSTSNYSQFDVQQTIVIDRTGKSVNAEHVAELLGVKNFITQKNKEYFLDVSIIIGNDYNKLKAIK